MSGQSVSHQRARYKNKVLPVAISEILFGIASLAMATTTFIVPNEKQLSRLAASKDFTKSAQGIWTGAIIIISGILGIIIYSKPSVSMYKINMFVSVLSAIVGGVGIVLTVIALTNTWTTTLGLHAGIFLSLMGGTTSSIVHSAYCCGGICGVRRKNHVVVRIPRSGGATDDMVRLPPGQYMIVEQMGGSGNQNGVTSSIQIISCGEEVRTGDNRLDAGNARTARDFEPGANASQDAEPPCYDEVQQPPLAYTSIIE